MRSQNISMRAEVDPMTTDQSFSNVKRRRLLSKTIDQDRSNILAPRSPPPSVKIVMNNILQKTFKHNHHEDLELSSLNDAQRKYLKKMLNRDQNKLPFKMPHRDDESETRGRVKELIF